MQLFIRTVQNALNLYKKQKSIQNSRRKQKKLKISKRMAHRIK